MFVDASGKVAQEVGFGELCIFYEPPFCCSLNSCGAAPDGEAEFKMKRVEGRTEGGREGERGVWLQERDSHVSPVS